MLNLEQLSIPVNRYKNLSLLFYIDKILGYQKKLHSSQIFLAPANDQTLAIADWFEQRGTDVYLFDCDKKNIKTRVSQTTFTYQQLKKINCSQLFILSRYEDEITQTIRNYSQCNIVSLQMNKERNIKEFSDLLISMSDYMEERQFYSEIGEKRVIFVRHCNMSENLYKFDLISKALNVELIWYDPNQITQSYKNKESGHYYFSYTDMILFLLQRKTYNNVTFIPIVGNDNFTSIALFKYLLPDIKIIVYLYDWLDHFCPYDKINNYLVCNQLSHQCADAEYKSYFGILDGTLSDGIFYKDYSPDYAPLNHYPKKKSYLPYFFAQNLWQENSYNKTNPLKKILFLGEMHIPTDTSGLVDNLSDIREVIKKLSQQGFEIGLYDKGFSQEKMKTYLEMVGNPDLLNILQGENLETLLPKINGNYQWGYLLYDRQGENTHIHYNITLSSKLFAYACLGIPVLVTNQLGKVAALVSEYNIGIVIDPLQIPELDKLITSIDYQSMLNNVKNFRQIYDLDTHINKFSLFFSEIFDT